MHRTVSLMLRFSLIAVAALSFAGCNDRASTEARMEKPIVPAAQPTPQPSATPASKLLPPTRFEVEAAFHRIFGDDLIADHGPGQSFIVGDFNGDGSEDLALVARPAPGKLQDVNNELSNWIIQDADKALIPVAGKNVVIPRKEARPTVANGEEVLAIIHGFGPSGWRNPDARQAYVIKHAAATLLGTAPSISQKAVRAMHLPVETEIIKQVRNNKKGFLFWTGSVYAWRPSES